MNTKLNKDQEKFLKCLTEEYSGFADTGNLESDLTWTPHKVAAVGRALKKKNLITITPGAGTTLNSNREGTGSVYALVK